ncbi:neuroendocrine convertase [Anaeramoeba flamelloides]|uniref:Neuroendocrine convertase n=1 Tax=Anaeramoeba flamelloides TaxID=1746091 RepID=A0AAV7Y4Q3_9EUKA|nr:neuroendocrine convertase [Anaeramoeba flamelloides]
MKITITFVILLVIFSFRITKYHNGKFRIRSPSRKDPTSTGELIVTLREGVTEKEFIERTGLLIVKKLAFGKRNYLIKKLELEIEEGDDLHKGDLSSSKKQFSKKNHQGSLLKKQFSFHKKNIQEDENENEYEQQQEQKSLIKQKQKQKQEKNSQINSFQIGLELKGKLDQVAEYYEENKYYKPYLKSYQPNDPLFVDQFHLLNTGQFDGIKGFDINVQPVWEKGIFGKGINLVIVDDGLFKDHQDIKGNYNPDLSYDYCKNTNDPTGYEGDTHGTACAGMAGASGDDGACGVGIAPGVNLSGRRIICDGISFADLAESLGDEQESVIDISSNSWGDFGCDVYGCSYTKISRILKEAILEGTKDGRNGKGIIYTFAAGNEGHYGGNVNHYSVMKMLEVITVAAVSNGGRHPFYSNIGTGILVSTISSGKNLKNRKVYTRTTGRETTTDCDLRFSGTSSATPLLAGGVTLILEANSNLTSWDVQSILIESATFIDPPYKDNRWVTNNAGYKFSPHFGFGLFDASKAVQIAENWENLPQMQTFVTPIQNKTVDIPDHNKHGVNLHLQIEEEDSLTITGGVILFLSVEHSYIGDLDIKVISPHGSIAYVMDKNFNFDTKLENHYFAIRTFYGENSKGEWTLNVRDYEKDDKGRILNWKLEFCGIKQGLPRVGDFETRTLTYPEMEGSVASNSNYVSFFAIIICFSFFFII